ncbi:MAG: glycoside hydrolase family 88 protein [Clostridia bacterium]|nr:glycoside hydrolase family 88 protein [Clostridia bacterium]
MKRVLKIISIVLALIFLLGGCSDFLNTADNSDNNRITFGDNPVDREHFVSSTVDPKIENSQRFEAIKPLTEREITEACDFIIERIDANLIDFTDKYPSANSENYVYSSTENKGWTEGFWTGMLWLAYEYTQDPKYKSAAAIQCNGFRDRLDKNVALQHHDIGFLYYLSCVKGYEITGMESMKETALLAADKLLERYNEKGKYIQAWGEFGKESEQRLIIDTMMNLELLYWAYNQTGNEDYYNAAYEHAKTTAMVITRTDASTHHTYYINPETGNPSHGVTSQGLSDDSSWSRGHAWGIYGFYKSYKYTDDALFMNEGIKIANYFLNHLPEDFVCYWDLTYIEGDEPRDTSAAAIAASGLLSCSKLYESEYNDLYTYAAHAILRSLIGDYTTKNIEGSNSILCKGVYSKPGNIGVGESLIWGDYYYMEALMKLRGLE